MLEVWGLAPVATASEEKCGNKVDDSGPYQLPRTWRSTHLESVAGRQIQEVGQIRQVMSLCCPDRSAALLPELISHLRTTYPRSKTPIPKTSKILQTIY